MPLNKFGRASRPRNSSSSRQIYTTLSLNNEGDYDFRNRRLCNVNSPIDDNDVSTKQYVEESVKAAFKTFYTTLEQHNNIETKVKESFDSEIAEIRKYVKTVEDRYLKTVAELSGSRPKLSDSFNKGI